jgi:hypothetical protein
MPDILKAPDQNEFIRLLSKALEGGTTALNQIPSSMFAPPAIRNLVSNNPNNFLGNAFVKPTQTLTEDASYGMPLSSGKGMTFRPDERFIDAAGLVAPFAKPAGLAAKTVGKSALNELLSQIESGTGIVGRNVVDPRMYAHLPSTPLKPNPEVGTRFTGENLGGLVEKKPFKLEENLGSSVMIMPWDSSSRNFNIKSVSDIPVDVTTHGGQNYARDIQHIKEGVAGASNEGIAKRIADREKIAIEENLAQGGTGKILHMPITMASGAENFSVMPMEVLQNILDTNKLSKAQIKALDESIKNYPITKNVGGKNVVLTPFTDFKGIMTEQGRNQLYTGEGINSTAGELRKAYVDRLGLKKNQEMLGYNLEDVIAAIQDPALRGVPKGSIGNTVIKSSEGGMKLTPSKNATYDTNFSGDYAGTLGANIPIEKLLEPTYNRIASELAGRKSDLRNMTIGAMEKRKSGVSTLVDDAMLEREYKYKQYLKSQGLL